MRPTTGAVRVQQLFLLSLTAASLAQRPLPASSVIKPVEELSLSYYGCIHLSWLDLRKIFVFPPMMQAELSRPGPIACYLKCIHFNSNYTIFLVHLPAKGPYTNQLVCGCGAQGALDHPPSGKRKSGLFPDASCHLPCPQSGNDTVDAAHLTAQFYPPGSQEEVVTEEPMLPTTIGERPAQQRILSVPGGAGTSRRTSRLPPDHQSCGDGRGLLSVYTATGRNNQPFVKFWSVLSLSLLVSSIFF